MKKRLWCDWGDETIHTSGEGGLTERMPGEEEEEMCGRGGTKQNVTARRTSREVKRGEHGKQSGLRGGP